MLSLSACVVAPVQPEAEHVVAKTDNEILIDNAMRYGLDADEVDRGVRIFLPKLAFGYNRIDLSDTAQRKIVFIAKVLGSDQAGYRSVVVSGHADSLGTPENNLKVSKFRAEEVTARLQGYGIDGQRITKEWHGDAMPIVPNTFADGTDNPEGRALNRRVEIIILNP